MMLVPIYDEVDFNDSRQCAHVSDCLPVAPLFCNEDGPYFASSSSLKQSCMMVTTHVYYEQRMQYIVFHSLSLKRPDARYICYKCFKTSNKNRLLLEINNATRVAKYSSVCSGCSYHAPLLYSFSVPSNRTVSLKRAQGELTVIDGFHGKLLLSYGMWVVMRNLKHLFKEKSVISGIKNTCTQCGVGYQSNPSKKLLKCSGCNLMRYCSKECQRTNWPLHKQLCKAMFPLKRKYYN